MVKITMEIEGMACAMCEAHVNDAVRKAFSVKKIKSSHTKGKTEIIMEEKPDEKALTEAVSGTGYTVRSVKTEPFEKKGFSVFRK